MTASTPADSHPPIAVEPPEIAAFFEEAITRGGGRPADTSEAEALLWTDNHDPDGLRRTLAGNPGIRWVQLPSAGVEGMIDVIDGDHI